MQPQSRILLSAIILFSILVSSCSNTQTPPAAQTDTLRQPADNPEIKRMAELDQQMRIEDKPGLEEQDSKHRKRIFELLANGQVITPKDKFRAALILQHTGLEYCNNTLKSLSAENYLLAYQLSKSAGDAGDTAALYFSALALDRYLSLTEGYQKYGTQQFYDEKTDAMLWSPIDSTTTDAERAKYGIKPLAELLKEAPMKPWPKPAGR
ncbi:MAG: hypothetical protein IM638_11815 [Bacteroidetes bacterium]|nr:hypothetical protein [Bacteroidota bacterium]